jgi:hypothetical protein
MVGDSWPWKRVCKRCANGDAVGQWLLALAKVVETVLFTLTVIQSEAWASCDRAKDLETHTRCPCCQTSNWACPFLPTPPPRGSRCPLQLLVPSHCQTQLRGFHFHRSRMLEQRVCVSRSFAHMLNANASLWMTEP